MDEIADYNIRRWNALAEAKALFTRPALDLDAESARSRVDPEGLLGDLHGKRVLCLASGGGQQSVAFALLGAAVTVVDISDEQLARDVEAGAHYGVALNAVQADMRDLSALPRDTFDLVWHPYSLSFVPDPVQVFREAAAVLVGGGTYYLQVANPFTFGLAPEDWNGAGYSLRFPYQDGLEVTGADAAWVYERDGEHAPISGPREYRHTLSTLVNGLSAQGFAITALSDSRDMNPDPAAAPGSWDHFVSVAPPWISIWSRLAR